MSTIEKVSLEDVYPSEVNPRSDFGDIGALAESFQFNAENPGEPFNPPVVVRDGGIYQIIDGERRYRAMRHLKLTHAHVLVCEDMDEANAVTAMLATDDKQPLSEVERSRGVQQMLLLGVDPVKVDKAARLSPGTAAMAKRARTVVDDAAEDMSLLRLIAIGEFADDEDAVDELTCCTEADFPSIEKRLRREREAREGRAAMEQALAEHGVDILDERPADMAFLTSTDDPKRIPEEAQAATFSHAATFSLYGEADQKVDPEEEARRERTARMDALYEECRASREAWLAEHLEDDLSPLIATCAESPYGWRVVRFAEDHGIDLPKGVPDAIHSYLSSSIQPYDFKGEYFDAYVGRFCRLTDALRECGYEPGEAEVELYEGAKTLMEGGADE